MLTLIKVFFPCSVSPTVAHVLRSILKLCNRQPAKLIAVVVDQSKCTANLDSLQAEFESCHHTETFDSLSHIL